MDNTDQSILMSNYESADSKDLNRLTTSYITISYNLFLE